MELPRGPAFRFVLVRQLPGAPGEGSHVGHEDRGLERPSPVLVVARVSPQGDRGRSRLIHVLSREDQALFQPFEPLALRLVHHKLASSPTRSSTTTNASSPCRVRSSASGNKCPLERPEEEMRADPFEGAHPNFVLLF